MPGQPSLRAGEYYAHPRNLFWHFMESMLDVDRSAPYRQRIAQLLARRVALWDVLKSCTRESSLDSDIVSSSIVPNDFATLFREYPSIQTVCFNGAKAATSFRKHVFPRLSDSSGLIFHSLPSTSPANASIPFERKLAAWEAAWGEQCDLFCR
jgi:TDG/mug DNA glycosylase family protein